MKAVRTDAELECPGIDAGLRARGVDLVILPDGTKVVVNNAQAYIGQQVDAQVQSTHQTGAGIIVFADLRATLSHGVAPAPTAAAPASAATSAK